MVKTARYSSAKSSGGTTGIALLILWATYSVALAQGKPEKERIRIGHAARAVAHSVPYVATQAGFFRKEGLQVEIVQTSGSVASMALIFKSRKEETLAILAKFMRTNDREALEEAWNHYGAEMPVKPYAVESAVQAVINHLAERETRYAQRKPAEFIDSGPLSELDPSGFIDRLYGTK